jgi:hypothetical protein
MSAEINIQLTSESTQQELDIAFQILSLSIIENKNIEINLIEDEKNVGKISINK